MRTSLVTPLAADENRETESQVSFAGSTATQALLHGAQCVRIKGADIDWPRLAARRAGRGRRF